MSLKPFAPGQGRLHSETQSQTNEQNRGRNINQLVECLPSTHKAQKPTPSTTDAQRVSIIPAFEQLRQEEFKTKTTNYTD